MRRNRRMTRIGFCLGLIASLASLTKAPTAETLDLTAVGKDPRWKIVGRTTSIVDMKGKHALKLSEGPGIGLVWLGGYEFANGTIDVDILGRSQPVQGSFVGVALRVRDAEN